MLLGDTPHCFMTFKKAHSFLIPVGDAHEGCMTTFQAKCHQASLQRTGSVSRMMLSVEM